MLSSSHASALWAIVTLLFFLPSSSNAASYTFRADLTLTHTTSGLRYAAANFLSPQMLAWGVPGNRVGGDDQTVYNPTTDTSNADNDFFWSNGAPFRPFQELPSKGQSFVDLMVLNSIKANSTLFMLIPLAGWVANGVPDCGSFPIAEYGHQQKEWTKYGNGVLPNGTQLSGDWRCYVPLRPQGRAQLARAPEDAGGRAGLRRARRPSTGEHHRTHSDCTQCHARMALTQGLWGWWVVCRTMSTTCGGSCTGTSTRRWCRTTSCGRSP